MNTLKTYIIGAAALMTGAVTAYAQQTPAATATDSSAVYTIERCYELVEENYPLVERYKLLDLTEEFTLKNAYMNYFPQISLQGSASYQTDVLEFPFDLSPYGIEMPTFSKDQYAVIVELSQVLWDGGMIAANRANIRAKADVDMAQQDINMYSLREKVNDLYFGALYLDQQIRQVDILMSDLERERKRIENCIANGVANLSDLDLIEVERITQNQNRESLRSMLDAYLRVLTIMTGVKIDDSRCLVIPVPDGIDREAMLTALIEAEIRRPELSLYKAQELEIDTQLDYWTAGGLPQFSLFIRGGYGRPGLNMMDNSFQPFAIGGIRLVWNISQLYSLGYGKKIVNYSKDQINTVRETFLFNTNLQVEEQVAEIRRYFKIVEDDEKIVELRENIRKSTEAGVENGTKNASDLVSEINKENAARKQLIMHQIEMMKAIYELKTIKNS
ncbi:MAG TPA: TolC family protein [Candidatus Coprenecus stercoravium]|uniref:TolC family protein n=1 Tax=Candidatus Coprenecus stercoravium TaxID=2840735 RepID=A0A9D2GQU8_9BACT|nr:TolC family protein [Candidatus Coprenecus stercoravium]